jgi:hypothetical protein
MSPDVRIDLTMLSLADIPNIFKTQSGTVLNDGFDRSNEQMQLSDFSELKNMTCVDKVLLVVNREVTPFGECILDDEVILDRLLTFSI